MRAKYLSFTPSDEDADGIADDLATGTDWSSSDAEWLATAVPDGLAHQLVVTTAGNEPAGNAPSLTLTGTDADGNAITDTVVLPNATTVETAKYFSTVTSATTGTDDTIDTMDIGWVDEFVSQTVPLDQYANRPATAQLTITGTIAVDIEDTLSDIRDGGEQSSWTWLNDANFTNKTASVGGNLAADAIRAVRVVANSYSSGATLELALAQAR